MVRRTIMAVGCMAALAAAVGCVPPPQTSGQLLDRLVSAEEISAAGTREHALSSIARDAAGAGDVGLCLRSLDGILLNNGLRDLTAAGCADRLNALGDRPAADLCVSRINAPALRDRMRIAFADHPAPPRTFAY